MSIVVNEIVGPNLVTPSQYANIMGVNRLTVHNHIHSGKIEIVQVGRELNTFIDYEKYKDYKFKEQMRRR